jgi:hypothetical protein
MSEFDNMKIKIWKDMSPSKINLLGEMRYFLIHLKGYQDFDIVKSVLINDLRASLVDELEWVWLRIGTFEKDGNKLIMYWDDDLGIFFITADHSEKETEWLENLIKEAIPSIEAKILAN